MANKLGTAHAVAEVRPKIGRIKPGEFYKVKNFSFKWRVRIVFGGNQNREWKICLQKSFSRRVGNVAKGLAVQLIVEVGIEAYGFAIHARQI
jgi:hypothetical protein